MPHIPPIRFAVVAANGPAPLTIEGGENDIKITHPTSSNVQTSIGLDLSQGGGGFTVNPAAPPAKIARIELEVGQGSNLVFTPTTDGSCKINIYFDHHPH